MTEHQPMATDSQERTPAVDFSEFAATTYESWKAAAIEALKGGKFEKLLTKTDEGITLEPIYTPEHCTNLQHMQGLPGFADYLRGTTTAGYAKEPWKIAQPCHGWLVEEANEIVCQELASGATCIRLDFDAATQRGCEPGEPLDGISVATLDDVHQLFSGIDVSKTPLYAASGISSAALLSLLAAYLRANGKKSADLSGCLGADPLGFLARHGELPCSLDAAYDEMAHCVAWSSTHAPHLATILVRGQTYHDGGANAVQELGYAMAGGIAYIRALQLRGLDIDTIAGQICFSFSSGANVFMEIAKFRAARVIWSQIIEAFGGSSEARKLRMYADTSWFTKTVHDPYVNMLRTTTEAFAAVVGGVDGLSITPFDAAVRPSDEFSRRIARNTQLILSRECNLLQPVDPAGGSWYLETLTDQLATGAWELLQSIDQQGGLFSALQAGEPQSAIAAVLAKRRSKLQTRADRSVGSNMYANPHEELLTPSTGNEQEKRKTRNEKLAEYCATIDDQARDQALAVISSAAGGQAGALIDAMCVAHFAGATLAQTFSCARLDEEAQRIDLTIAPSRLTEEFEALRRRTREYQEQHGQNIRVFLANMGPIPQHKARAEFSTGFMEVGGFEVLGNDGFEGVDQAVAAAVDAAADVTIICSTDDAYPEIVPQLTRRLKEVLPSMKVFLAGAPAEEHKASYDEAGIDEYIHVRANCYKILSQLQQAGGTQHV